LNCTNKKSSSKETTQLVLETLLSLVSQPEGAEVFTEISDLDSLTEIAPSQPLVLDIFSYAWLNATLSPETDKDKLRSEIDIRIGALVSSFKGTDAVTLMAFLADLLPRLDRTSLTTDDSSSPSPYQGTSTQSILPQNPKWLPSLIGFIRNLVTSRPTTAGRAAYTNLAAALLEVYPQETPPLLFTDKINNNNNNKTTTAATSEKPFSFLLLTVLLIDIRSSLPTLLSQLNSPSYAATARRLSSAFNITSNFIGYLLRSIDDSSSSGAMLIMPPDLLLKLRKSVSETVSLTLEYLRDRWDASVAGAMGLHPDARSAAATDTATGYSRLALAWDSIDHEGNGGGVASGSDPLVLAAVRCLAIWLREDDNEVLRKEASGLLDMFVELYHVSCSSLPSAESSGKTRGRRALDFRRPVLVALEGITADTEDNEDNTGIEALLSHEGWKVLTADLITILYSTSSSASASGVEEEAERGTEIIRVLLPIVEKTSAPREEWMDLVTRVAGWDVPTPTSSSSLPTSPPVVLEFQIAVLQLVTALLAAAHPGMRRRYVHSASAVVGIARQLREMMMIMAGSAGGGMHRGMKTRDRGHMGMPEDEDEDMGGPDSGLLEALDDVETTLGSL